MSDYLENIESWIFSLPQHRDEQKRKFLKIIEDNFLSEASFSNNNNEQKLKQIGIPVFLTRLIKGKLLEQKAACENQTPNSNVNLSSSQIKELCSNLDADSIVHRIKIARLLMQRYYKLFPENTSSEWKEAHAKMLIDCYPSTIIDGDTPFGLWFRPSTSVKIFDRTIMLAPRGLFEEQLAVIQVEETANSEIGIEKSKRIQTRPRLISLDRADRLKQIALQFEHQNDFQQIRERTFRERQKLLWSPEILDVGEYIKAIKLDLNSLQEVESEFLLWTEHAPEHNLESMMQADINLLKQCATKCVSNWNSFEENTIVATLNVIQLLIRCHKSQSVGDLHRSHKAPFLVEELNDLESMDEVEHNQNSLKIYKTRNEVFITGPCGIINCRGVAEAVAHAFKLFYCLQLRYPKDLLMTWEFIQARYFKINETEISSSVAFFIAHLNELTLN